VRAEFPILAQEVNGRPLVYLDNAATSQKPAEVLAAMEGYYGAGGYNSNVHRGVHALSARATTAYEAAREKVARFVNAASPQEIVYTRNATEAINLVASSWGGSALREGDEVVLSVAEHHSNLVPWQLLAQRRGLVLKFVGLTESEELDLEQLAGLITPRTRLVSLVHVSNMLGCVLPTQRAAELAHAAGAKLLLDCCQSGARRGLAAAAQSWAGWAAGRAAPRHTTTCPELPPNPACSIPSPSSPPPVQCPTCPWMCRPWALTGSWPPPTRCAAPRASASCGGAARCWRRCRPGWGAAR
jgi:hypothetical protein